MTLFTKCILSEASPEDGQRISVMSRHTLNDGVTPHPEITEDRYDLWLLGLSPPPALLGAYYKRGLPWVEFELAYLEYLQEKNPAAMVRDLAKRANERDITIMCIEETPEQCHRRLLAEECQRVNPDLRIVVR